MTRALDDLLSRVLYVGPEPFERDEHGLPIVYEDDPDDLTCGLPWST